MSTEQPPPTEYQYPVVVTGTSKWLVWVAEAGSHHDAYRMVEDYPHEYVGDTQPLEAWLSADKPDEWSMGDVYDHYAPDNDAHVRTHRASMAASARAES